MTKRERAPELCCPVCATELSIEQLFAHAEDRQAFARLASISVPLGARVLVYINLFAPAKNRMTIARKVKLIDELLPDLARGEIDRKGRAWAAPHDAWRSAIDQMLAARDNGKLALPLTSHGYLYEILAGMADKAEAAQERVVEQDRRQRGRSETARSLDELITDGLSPDHVGTSISRHLHLEPSDPEAAARGRAIREQLIAARGAKKGRLAAEPQSTEEGPQP